MAHVVRQLKSRGLWIFAVAVVVAVVVGLRMEPRWIVEKVLLAVQVDDQGELYVEVEGERFEVDEAIPLSEAPPKPQPQIVYESREGEGRPQRLYYQYAAHPHWGIWSFLPAATAIVLCWISKEPISALLGGIVVGALLVGQFDVLGAVLIPSISTANAATILVLYLWLLGGLMGIWARTGASEAFATYMARHFVRGPRSAKFVAWCLGIVFFQGGTISSVLVGTTVRPLADEERVSHEELSLIVDATSSPIAILLAFNAWPFYVQAFLGVAGVSYLATEQARVAFFFQSVPLSFYALASVIFTLLVALEKHPYLPAKLKQARDRARLSGQLNAPGSEPLADNEYHTGQKIAGFETTALDFFLPLVLLLGVAVGTYAFLGSPNVLWAFCAALLLACGMAWLKGVGLRQLVAAIIDGQKGVILGSVILLLAITIGKLSQDVGGGYYLASLLGGLKWYWLLPAMAFLIAVVIAFSTGTCWGTYAVAFPLVMPLAHAVAMNQELNNPQLFVSLCFVACLNGGVFGDQCSPISDTTILSSIATGADLMDHVTTQIPVALQAAALALVGWTAIALFL